MNTPARYILIVLFVIISLHYILTLTHEPYSRATSGLPTILSPGSKGKPHVPDSYYNLDGPSGMNPADVYNDPKLNTTLAVGRANATFIILCRNNDLASTIRSIREMEDRFNRRAGYPYVLLNEEEFTDEFKKRISVLTDAKIEYGLIPHDHWFQPDWIDEDKAREGREKMQKDNIIYGGSVSYRNMCRFNSGFFFRHPLVQKYRWYWRIEPDVHFHCDINFDPFMYMAENNKTYGFTITMYEYEATIPTMWGHVRQFMHDHPEFVAQDNALGFMSENDGEKYNLCHFWSNFEIADMDFWRGPAYTAFFDYLDKQGGFYYERWGDAPVHSIAAAIFLPRSKIHFFNEIGYEHNPYTHCPKGAGNWERGKCSCDPDRSFDYDGYSCMSKWDKFMGYRW